MLLHSSLSIDIPANSERGFYFHTRSPAAIVYRLNNITLLETLSDETPKEELVAISNKVWICVCTLRLQMDSMYSSSWPKEFAEAVDFWLLVCFKFTGFKGTVRKFC